ncbi:hypothetical protein DB32_006118 [Sandaracinus amylolyticus]|uniref:Uncharacterized protein n=1 Tax=Sandaracinus amylolyticus TaxID=927083 RepID=A0A0F6SGM8_9BACT|nr:hypothetical protein DB32_006118 [Sandaracinus amylolyticus]
MTASPGLVTVRPRRDGARHAADRTVAAGLRYLHLVGREGPTEEGGAS